MKENEKEKDQLREFSPSLVKKNRKRAQIETLAIL